MQLVVRFEMNFDSKLIGIPILSSNFSPIEFYQKVGKLLQVFKFLID